jgi:hypothetical protein
MRSAVNQANSLENNASSTAAGYGSGAANISSTLIPFLTRELNNPGGISQQDQTAMLSASQGGAGGLAGGLATKANERAGATGNASGVTSALDDIARQRMKAAAGGSEAIAGQNAETKLNQQQEGAEGLSKLYGTDVGAQLGALGVQNNAIGQEVNAGDHGWFQNLTSMISALRGGGSGTTSAMPTMGGGSDVSTLDTSGGADPLMLNAPSGLSPDELQMMGSSAPAFPSM